MTTNCQTAYSREENVEEEELRTAVTINRMNQVCGKKLSDLY